MHVSLRLLLDANFHVEKTAGELARTMERGVRAIVTLVRAGLFYTLPSLLELLAVSAVLWRSFNVRIALECLGTFALYCGWTFALAKACTVRRQEANSRDSRAAGRAVDALNNFTLINILDNARLERNRYGDLVRHYQNASLQADRASAALNAGQSVVLALGLSGCLVDVCIATGGDVGSVIMANSLIVQLYSPLQFLGVIYRFDRNACGFPSLLLTTQYTQLAQLERLCLAGIFSLVFR